MLFVSNIDYISSFDFFKDLQDDSTSFCELGQLTFRYATVRLYISDTDTGCRIVLDSSKLGLVDFMAEVKRLSPYGVVFAKTVASAVPYRDCAIAIDKFSLKLLEYVEHIEYSTVRLDKPVSQCINMHEYTHIDNQMSLYMISKKDFSAYFTLLHIMCRLRDNWVDDSFWFPSSKPVYNVSDSEIVVYKVSFNDVIAAKRMVTKALLAGVKMLDEGFI